MMPIRDCLRSCSLSVLLVIGGATVVRGADRSGHAAGRDDDVSASG